MLHSAFYLIDQVIQGLKYQARRKKNQAIILLFIFDLVLIKKP